ncbi:GNAT family N-acetyltransferase [Hutsoniella sourekii]
MYYNQIKSATDLYSDQVEALYLSSFPEVERKSIDKLYDHAIKDKSDIFVFLNDQDEFIGFAVTLKNNDLVLIEYIAIDPNASNQGYGSKALALLGDFYQDATICLEIESTTLENVSNQNQRMRRLAFYERNDYQLQNLDVSYFGEPMELMANQPNLNYQDYQDLYVNIYGQEITDDVHAI